jgi:DNA-binding XRE family transcriptional regulator
MNIGNKKLKQLMAKKSLSQSELARRTNVPQPTINRMLSGITKQPKYTTALALANYFQVTTDEIFQG